MTGMARDGGRAGGWLRESGVRGDGRVRREMNHWGKGVEEDGGGGKTD